MRLVPDFGFSCWRRRVSCVAAVFVVALAAMSSQTTAATMDYFSSFGTLENEDYLGKGGICVAVSYINGATYLQNAYSSIYGGTTLATGSTGSNQLAARAFSYDGWTYKGTSYDGYYTRVESDNNGFGDWWQTMIDWTECYAANRTTYSGQCAAGLFGEDTSSWTYNSNITDCFPTYDFLSSAASNDYYIEVGIDAYIENGDELSLLWGHAINLLNLTKKNGKYTITYQDPNDPTIATSTTATIININGENTFSFSIYDSYNVFIDSAFVMAAKEVPEPGTFVLLAIGSVMLFGFVRFRRKQTA